MKGGQVANDESMVYIKCMAKGAAEQGLRVHAILGREWFFHPYCAIPLEDFKRTVGYFKHTPGEFEIVEAEEYFAWTAEIEAKAATIIFCGDSGGIKANGDFCWKRVDENGQRCEHHGGNDKEMQGKYGPLVERPPMPPTVLKRFG